jgi:Ca2+/H+ antiporter, TMEM165/GDT1 family
MAAGSVLGMLPHRWLELIIGVVFLIGAAVLLRSNIADGDAPSIGHPSYASFIRVSAASFGVIMLAELGDMTQIITANLAAKYHHPVAVLAGAVLALWAAAAVAILGGRSLIRLVPLVLIACLAAVVMAVLGVVSLVSAAGG